jgi:3-deoxy-D-manno-oct-2-ulosonic acid (Kdo) hydroxylase
MQAVTQLDIEDWRARPRAALQDCAGPALEAGSVLSLPGLPFELLPAEQTLLQPGLEEQARSKNISLSPDGSVLRGFGADGVERQLLQTMMQRYAAAARSLVASLMPAYAAALRPGRTSFRPAEIEGRATSWRKDDTRLHVDSFPSSPTAGWRILRVFSNINPRHKPRTWRLGEPFQTVARRFLPRLAAPVWGSSLLLHTLRLTKQRRTPYDHYMLGLHDGMKADLDYQATAMQQVHEFPSATTWVVYTDQVSHAATRGQHVLEQTLLLPVRAMREPQRSPLCELERLLGRSLA